MPIEVDGLQTFGALTRVGTVQPTDIIPGERAGAPISMLADTLRAFILAAIADGSGVTFGVVAPDNATGSQGDVYIRTTGEIYSRSATTWDLQIDFVSQAELTTAISGLVTTTALTTAITNHQALTDPHPTYLTQTEGDARYPLQTATDPYPGYLTQTEAAALFSPLGGDAQGGLRYALSLATTSPPSSGQVRFNNAAIASVTQIFIHESDRNSAAQSEILDAIALGTRLQVALESNEEIYAWFRVSGAVVDNGSDRAIPVAFISSAGVFAAEEATLNFLQIQGTASSGGGASGIQYTYSTIAGTGVISAADLTIATSLTINSTDAQSKTAADVLARLKAGAIVEIAASAANRIRYAVTSDYASGAVGVAVAAVYGAIAVGSTIYLSIWSDAPIPGPPGAGSTIRIREIDNSPNDPVTDLVVPNGSLAISSGIATLNFSTTGGGGRVSATASRTYYVRADGQRTGDLVSETDATTNVAADAFPTINSALNALKKLDFRGFSPTLFVGAGVFQESVALPSLLGADTANLTGDGIASTTLLYELSGGNGFVVSCIGISTVWTISSLKISSSSNNKIGIQCSNAYCNLTSIHLDTSWIDTFCGSLGLISISGNYTISRNKFVEWYANATGNISVATANITFSGSPSFSGAVFFCADGNPVITFASNTLSGSAMGVRYRVSYGGKILSTTAEASLPGDQTGGSNNGNFYQI